MTLPIVISIIGMVFTGISVSAMIILTQKTANIQMRKKSENALRNRQG